MRDKLPKDILTLADDFGDAIDEEKEADRGLEESERLVARGYMSRWIPEGADENSLRASLQAYDVMRPKADDITTDYRGSKA